MTNLAKAIAIAAQAHQEQVDKAGQPYILHPLRIMLKMSSDTEKTVAILHDLVEDTPWTLEHLRTSGFSEEIVQAIEYLTRRPAETYSAFIERIAGQPLARSIKLADLEDNMNLLRLSDLTASTVERLQKYHRAWVRLKSAHPTHHPVSDG